jgi:hypothetical protein
MLNNFVEWAKKIADTSHGSDIEACVTVNELSGNSAARLDIDTPTAVARITCWESGDYYAEALDLETEKTIFSEHGNLDGMHELTEQFAGFFKSVDM